MSDLRALYQETILDHGRRPRNFGSLEHTTHEGEGYNPLCGDKVHVYLQVEDDVVRNISFEGAGCAISTSSASLMTEAVKGKSLDQVQRLFERVHAVMTGSDSSGSHGHGGEGALGGASRNRATEGEQVPKLGKLVVFEGVRQYPLRVKCATLAWHTLTNALESRDEVAKTE
ncbi:MAG: Fe-S cluster assembly sulfur transfer protein SufU [Candidatus Binatia bacterium]